MDSFFTKNHLFSKKLFSPMKKLSENNVPLSLFGSVVVDSGLSKID